MAWVLFISLSEHTGFGIVSCKWVHIAGNGTVFPNVRVNNCNSSQPESSAPVMHFLCLHGMGTSAAMFRSQTGKLLDLGDEGRRTEEQS